MVTADAVRSRIEHYVKLMNDGNAGAIAELYAADATLEDPIGAEPRRGREAIHEFYKVSAGAVRLELSGPIRVCGSEAAFPMVGTAGSGDHLAYIDIVDVMTFDETAQITSMRAFWSPDAIRKAGA